MPELKRHLDELQVHPQMYCTQWYMTMFTTQFPFEMAVRIWDIYL